jgi:hypothetical protein
MDTTFKEVFILLNCSVMYVNFMTLTVDICTYLLPKAHTSSLIFAYYLGKQKDMWSPLVLGAYISPGDKRVALGPPVPSLPTVPGKPTSRLQLLFLQDKGGNRE